MNKYSERVARAYARWVQFGGEMHALALKRAIRNERWVYNSACGKYVIQQAN